MSKKPEFDTKRPKGTIGMLDSHGQVTSPEAKLADVISRMEKLLDCATGEAAAAAFIKGDEIQDILERLNAPPVLKRGDVVICRPPQLVQ